MAIDIDRIAASALDAFLEGKSEERSQDERRNRRLLGGVALGVGLAVAARAVYSRARNVDLEQVAGAVEERLRH